jgi:hypothetical protein
VQQRYSITPITRGTPVIDINKAIACFLTHALDCLTVSIEVLYNAATAAQRETHTTRLPGQLGSADISVISATCNNLKVKDVDMSC